MTTSPEQKVGDFSRLEFDLPDRMVKSLRASNMGVMEMAAKLGVSRATISNWTSGRVKPSKQSRLLWSLYTQVPYEWLETGKIPPSGGGPDGGTVSFLPGSNWRPSHYKAYASARHFARALRSRDEASIFAELCELAECVPILSCA